jgi:hypothetical protein
VEAELRALVAVQFRRGLTAEEAYRFDVLVALANRLTERANGVGTSL